MLPSLHFDARERWPGCISSPLDQGKCDGCWAFSTCQALSDRLRIKYGKSRVPELFLRTHANGTDSLNCLSPTYVIRNPLCGISDNTRLCKMGCKGGYIDTGIEYLVRKGSITLSAHEGATPQHHYKALGSRKITGGVIPMMEELVARGPIVAGFAVHQNFFDEAFDSFYDRVEGKELFKHAVCIVGWTTNPANGRKYWTCRNSYGPRFMDDGFFYILMGSNFLGIESDVHAIDV